MAKKIDKLEIKIPETKGKISKRALRRKISIALGQKLTDIVQTPLEITIICNETTSKPSAGKPKA